MKIIIPIMLLVILLTAIGVLAAVCTPSGEGYSRTYPPQGYTPARGPVDDPRCLPFRSDTHASNTALCWTCHPHQYQAWMRGEYLRQKFIMEG